MGRPKGWTQERTGARADALARTSADQSTTRQAGILGVHHDGLAERGCGAGLRAFLNRWGGAGFREADGMPPIHLAPSSGRYLSFAEREEIALLRAQQRGVREIDHWEGDLIIGLNRSAIGTLVERSTRFTMLLHLQPMAGHGLGASVKNEPALAGHEVEGVRDAIATKIATLPEQLGRSLTWDQGAEMARHAQLRIDTGLDMSFCDPRSL